MQFDFTLAANGSQSIEVAGRFIKLVSGTGKIRVRFDKGGYIDLLPGQGCTGLDFSRLTIEDRTGAGNVGVLLAGAFMFQDDRVTGDVSIIDGGKNRAIANNAFVCAGSVATSGAGNVAQTQLWNKSANKRLILEAFTVSSQTAGGAGFGECTVALPTFLRNAKNKRTGGAASAAGESRINAATTALIGLTESYGDLNLGANAQFTYVFREPIVIEPGFGFSVWHGATNVDLRCFYEFFEDAIG